MRNPGEDMHRQTMCWPYLNWRLASGPLIVSAVSRVVERLAGVITYVMAFFGHTANVQDA